MPTYTYACKSCDHTFDIRQSFTDDALTDCPECVEAGVLRKVIHPVGITFKGSGFYKTDSKSSSSSTSTSSSSSTSASGSSSTSTASAPAASSTAS